MNSHLNDSPAGDELLVSAAQEVFINPSFACSNIRTLDFPQSLQNGVLLTQLAYRVARQPKNLLNHMQRIRLAEALQARETLTEALADLFITLKDKGVDLRRQVLKRSWPMLSEVWRELFYRSFATGIDEKTPLPGRSRLTAGNIGRRDFIVVERVEKSRSVQQGEEEVLESARDLLDSGALDEARVLLENWLLSTDNALWQDGAHELARLYLYLEDGEARALAWWESLVRQQPEKMQMWSDILASEAAS